MTILRFSYYTYKKPLNWVSLTALGLLSCSFINAQESFSIEDLDNMPELSSTLEQENEVSDNTDLGSIEVEEIDFDGLLSGISDVTEGEDSDVGESSEGNTVIIEIPNTDSKDYNHSLLEVIEYVLGENVDVSLENCVLIKWNDSNWYIDAPVDNLTDTRRDLLGWLGKPKHYAGVYKWETNQNYYYIGRAIDIEKVNKRLVKAGEEKLKGAHLAGYIMRVVNKKAEFQREEVRSIVTNSITNRDMSPKASTVKVDNVKQKDDNAFSVLDKLGIGEYSGCPEGQVWIGPHMNERGEYVPGRCIPSTEAGK